jgi:SWI/SNF-related matrix-associated actin-dependent regulator 1 of chromatin subfamily A
LGKTCQVIAFFAHLLTKGITGPHLVVVPSSTLENWLREFANFCPALKVEPYYGTQKERPMMRDTLKRDRSWNVLVTTYQLATGDKHDRGFLKNLRFNCCVYDEGHLLKNGSSARYDSLIKLPADFRLLLTGTPLQNNLQELASLLAFILPSVFNEKREELASIFKYKAKTTDDDESNSALLSQQRIRRARAMMTPFVLRRKKQQVLKHLPRKISRVEYCTMNDKQNRLYQQEIASAQDAIAARAEGKKPNKNTTNVMMQLRKAAIHPLLFRSNYPDDKLHKMARDIIKEEAYENSNPQYVYEDMQVMNDLELSRLCNSVPRTLGKYALKKDEWMNAGKVEALTALLLEMKDKGDRVLVFSQFTQMLDILEMVLTTLDMGYLRIDGSTPVEARQDLIDQYHTETDIMVFLLSTKAGGFGINLACANKVIIYDSSFNPHDDAQASDRAHRVGQTREVEVIRWVILYDLCSIMAG